MDNSLTLPLFSLGASLVGIAGLVSALVAWPWVAQRSTRMRAVGFVLMFVVIVAALYASAGSPRISLQLAVADAQQRAATDRLATIQAQVRDHPKDQAAWMELGETYLQLGRAGMARFALLQAVAVNAKNPDALMAYAKAEIIASDGVVNAAAAEALHQLQRLRPDPQASLFLAIYDASNGETAKATAALEALLKEPALPANLQKAAREQLQKLQTKK